MILVHEVSYICVCIVLNIIESNVLMEYWLSALKQINCYHSLLSVSKSIDCRLYKNSVPATVAI
jgi:hypothetical protein